MHKIVSFILLIFILLQGCSIFRKTGVKNFQKAEGEIRAKDIVSNNLSNNSFYIQKASIAVTDGSISSRFLATLKFRYPDSLQISLKAKIGYEAVRIFMTKDTLIINDRINKKLRVGNPQDLRKKYGVDPDLIFVLLGDFIIDPEAESVNIKCHNGFADNRFVVGGRNLDYKIDCKLKKITGAQFEGEMKTGNLSIEFSGFYDVDGLIIPGVTLVSSDKSALTATIEVEKANRRYQGIIGPMKAGNNYDILRLR